MSRSSDLFSGVIFGRKEEKNMQFTQIKTEKKEKGMQYSEVKKERKTYLSGYRIVFETIFPKTDFIKLIREVSNYNGDINDEILERLNHDFIEEIDLVLNIDYIFCEFLERYNQHNFHLLVKSENEIGYEMTGEDIQKVARSASGNFESLIGEDAVIFRCMLEKSKAIDAREIAKQYDKNLPKLDKKNLWSFL